MCFTILNINIYSVAYGFVVAKTGDKKAAASYERHALATGLKDIERIAISHIRSLQSLLKWLWLGTQLNVPLDLGDV